MKGLVNGLGRGRESPLEDREGKPDGTGPLVVGKGIRTVELLADVFRDFLVESRLRL